MVSPELLRRYPFFGSFDDDELKAIAMLADEVTVEGGTTLFESGQPAEYLYLLIEGEVEWHYDSINPAHRERSKDYLIEDFSPGEPLGISAVLEPHVYLGRADVRSRSRLLRMDGPRLRVRRTGPAVFVDATITVGRHLAFERAHAVADAAEAALRERVPGADVVAHVEPQNW